MKHTKIITSLLLAGAFVFSSSLMAADGAKKGKKGKKPAAGEQAKGKWQDPVLSLAGITDEQKKECVAVRKSFAAKVKEAGQDQKKKQALYKERNAALAKILTKDQFAELKKKQAAANKARKAKGGQKGKGEKGKGKKKKDA